MRAAEDQYQIDLIARAITTLGWQVLITDRSGDTIRVTIERIRPPETPLTPQPAPLTL